MIHEDLMVVLNPNNKGYMSVTPISIDRVQIQQVLAVLQQRATCYPLDTVSWLFPDLTVDQAFLAIDALSRNDQVGLMRDADRTYRVKA